MQLLDFLRQEDLSFAEFARKINVQSRMTVVRYCRGTRIPTPEVMERIGLATAGAVTPNDFYATRTQDLERREAAARLGGNGAGDAQGNEP